MRELNSSRGDYTTESDVIAGKQGLSDKTSAFT